MRDYYINSELLKTKTTKAYSILYNIKDLLNKIETETNSAFHEINSHNELGKQSYESIKANIKEIEEYMDKYKKFGAADNLPDTQRSSCSAYEDPKIMLSGCTAKYGGFPGEYVAQVDGVYLNAIQSVIAKLRDSKLEDIRVDNNIGAVIETQTYSGSALTPKLNKEQWSEDKIGIEDLFKYGRISEAMQKEYEEIKPDIDAYNDKLYKYESEFNNDTSHTAYQKYLLYEQINDMKIDNYDKYINKMITQANFNYATTFEATVDGGLDLTGLAGVKMLVEGVTGKNYITNEEYSDEQRGIRIATLGAGSLLGKVLSKVTTETVATEEAASVSKTGGIVLSMNGTGELDNLFNKITKNVVDESKTITNNMENNGIQLGLDDLMSYRNEIGVPDRNTVAVGKTDIAGLEDYTFKGASPQVRTDAGLPHLDDIFPDRDITAPYIRSVKGHSQFMDHAEENVIAEFEDAINKAGLNPGEVEGTLYIHQSNPDGVCNKCTKGLFKDVPYDERGIFKQLTDKYPNLEIKVTTEIDPNIPNPRNTLSFDLQNGEASNVVQIRKAKK